MRSIIEEQLSRLSDIPYEIIDGAYVFHKKDGISHKDDPQDSGELRVIFEDYIIHPYSGFDFHVKFNNNTPPQERIMYGIIERETEKMYYFNLHSNDGSRMWRGYCPKKSCKVEKL